MTKSHAAPFRLILAAIFAALLSTAAVAQSAPASTAPATTAPISPAAPATIAPRTSAAPATRQALPAGTKVNLNTASAEQLDALPRVGKARLKVIMDERAKGPFKDWADFDKRTTHTSVNAGVKSKIKDLVTF